MARRFLLLIGLIRIFDLSNPRCHRAAVPVAIVDPCIADIVHRVQCHGYRFLFAELQKNLEVLSVVTKEPRAYHVRPIHLLMLIIVFHQIEHLANRVPGNKHVSDPVMDQSTGDFDRLPGNVA